MATQPAQMLTFDNINTVFQLYNSFTSLKLKLGHDFRTQNYKVLVKSWQKMLGPWQVNMSFDQLDADPVAVFSGIALEDSPDTADTDRLKSLKRAYVHIMMYLDVCIQNPGLTAKFMCPNLSSILHEDNAARRAEAVAQFCLLCLWVLDCYTYEVERCSILSETQQDTLTLILYGDAEAPTLEPPNFVPLAADIHDHERRVSLRFV